MRAEAARPGKHIERAMDEAARGFYRRLADGDPSTTRCGRCELTHFPPRVRCARCGHRTEWVPLPRRGTLEAFTTQELAVRFRAPAVLALARLDEVVVPGIATASYDELTIGAAVEMEPFAEPETGLTLIGFRPAQI